jgi:hypothetical protein
METHTYDPFQAKQPVLLLLLFCLSNKPDQGLPRLDSYRKDYICLFLCQIPAPRSQEVLKKCMGSYTVGAPQMFVQ